MALASRDALLNIYYYYLSAEVILDCLEIIVRVCNIQLQVSIYILSYAFILLHLYYTSYKLMCFGVSTFHSSSIPVGMR